MDADKAYVLGLLHDIGRKFGVYHLRHVSDGYKYMMSLGYDDVARICLTHSFNQDKLEAYVGNFDASQEDTELIRIKLKETVQDDYDKLIQLCDSIAGAEGVMDIIDRMSDVKSRYGSYDPEKWQTNLDLKEYFEKKMGMDLYVAVDKDNYIPISSRMVEFRKADIADAEVLVDIYNASFFDDYIKYGECPAYGRTKEMMEQSIIDYPKFLIIYDGKPVGCISCKALEDGIYEVGCLCVIPEFQGKGIGTAAMEFAKSFYSDWKKFTLVTPVDKSQNVRFYTVKCGFSIHSEEMDGNVKVIRFLLER